MSVQRSLKVCLDKEIHRIAKAPASFKALIETITPLFGSRLPEKWTLQYADSDEDTIMMSNEQDYKEFLEDSLSSSNKAVKIFIIPIEAHQLKADNVAEVEIMKEISAPVEEKIDIASEETQAEEKQEEALIEHSSGKVLEDGDIKIDMPIPDRVLKSERCANKIIRKLAQSNSSEMNPRLKAKLRAVEKVLPQEKKDELEKKKEQILSRRPPKESSKKDSPKRPDNKVIHEGIRCDGCSQISFSGIRYKCSVCPDFDYCGKCEAKALHSHPFIQMKKEEQIYNNSSSSSQSPSERPAHSQKAKHATAKKWKPASSTLASFLDTFENEEEHEDAYTQDDTLVIERNSQQEINNAIQQVYASEIEEKTLMLQEVFPDKHPLRVYDFVAEFHYLSLEALVEKGLLIV